MLQISFPLWQPLGQLLLQKKLISTAQLETALQEQQRTNKRLGEVIVKRKWLTFQDLDAVLLEQSAAWEYQSALGSLLVNKNLISCAQLQSALEEQQLTNKRLGEILIKRQWLTFAQLDQALEEQARLSPVN